MFTELYSTRAACYVAQEETGKRRLASTPTTFRFLRMMRDVQPPPPYEMNHRVTVHVFDQTYEWVGMQKHGARSVIETHNAQGMPVTIENEVYINSIEVTSARRHFLVILFIHWFIGIRAVVFQVKVPWILGNVSQAQLRAIDSNHGSAYTEPYNLLFNELLPRKVEGDTWLLAQARDGRAT